VNTTDVAIIANAVVDVAGIGAALTFGLRALPRPKAATPRQARKTGTSTAATTSAATAPEPPEESR
jgi:hypothetical protein